jgi:hypothetical protein
VIPRNEVKKIAVGQKLNLRIHARFYPDLGTSSSYFEVTIQP